MSVFESLFEMREPPGFQRQVIRQIIRAKVLVN